MLCIMKHGILMDRSKIFSNLVGQVAQLSHAAEENGSKASYEGSACDLPLLSSDKQVPTPADSEEAKASESSGPQLSSSEEVSRCFF